MIFRTLLYKEPNARPSSMNFAKFAFRKAMEQIFLGPKTQQFIANYWLFSKNPIPPILRALGDVAHRYFFPPTGFAIRPFGGIPPNLVTLFMRFGAYSSLAT